MAFWSAARLLLISFFCKTMFVSFSSPSDSCLRELRTCGCSPCLKKASSLALSLATSRAKYVGSETSLILAWSTPARSIFCEVAMTYRELTRLRGTPLILKGPVTRRTPWSRVLRSTTRLPLNRPASRMRTVPGVRESRGTQGRRVLRTCSRNCQLPLPELEE